MAGKHTASSSPTRSPMRTWLLGVAVMFAVRIAGDYAALMGATGWLWTTRLSELWLAGGLLVWAWKDMPVGDMLRGIGKTRGVAVGLLFVAVAAGQFLGPDASAYPFVHWNMYTASADEVTYGEVWLVDETGSRSRLDLSATDLATEPRALSGRLLTEAEAAADGDEDARRLLQSTLLVLAGDEFQATEAEVLRCVVDQPTSEAPSDCAVVTTVELEAP